MLSTLIYRSRAVTPMNAQDLNDLLTPARARNAALQVTGILLFDGVHFVQLLEGPDEAVNLIFDAIRRDDAHKNVVLLMQDHGPTRRFGGDAMALIDLRALDSQQVSARILAKMKKPARWPGGDDRVVKILGWYADAHGTDHIVEGDDAANWRFAASGVRLAHEDPAAPARAYSFALQPIVDPRRREITSFEFLIRGQSGGSPEQLFASLDPADRYRVDLESKASAFELARRLGLTDVKLSVNLLPMSLIEDPAAVDRLVDQIAACALLPQHVIVEITEQEAIERPRAFRDAIERLRRAGIGVAIDDFGAGYAGLSLLAEFQPDKLKIDRQLIQNIHQDGPRQAIVCGIARTCSAMGITPVAEGVERIEEWCWLQAAEIERFQGYLFAKPALNAVPEVQWPERVRLD
ncbi:diguanylate phosphodiesterase [Achromobacter insolitus]|uniref:diguanylate phosphodiesterase n=1 Tax=Achromobacter insolitus TaxID=217204 RepID=UPI00174B26FF|nr:diguanylate phosphodiesterase [Achromobacter insolitus]